MPRLPSRMRLCTYLRISHISLWMQHKEIEDEQAFFQMLEVDPYPRRLQHWTPSRRALLQHSGLPPAGVQFHEHSHPGILKVPIRKADWKQMPLHEK